MITVIRYDEVDSTNEEAKRLIAKGAAEGTVILAKTQKKGKGKRGKSWHSPLGGLYLSIILRPDLKAADLPELTILAATAVAETIKEITNLEVRIKWPNDVLLNGKKVCGILTEVKGKAVIVGIGLNVNNLDFSEEIKGKATSLKAETGRQFEEQKIIEILLGEFDGLYKG